MSTATKKKRKVDAEVTLTPDEERLVRKGFAQLRRGEYVTLEKLQRDLERRGRSGSRKTTKR